MSGDYDRNGLEILTDDECWRFLDAHHVGRLAVSIANQPEIFPVNYVVHRRSIVFVTAEGTKLAGALLGAGVSFEIDAADPLFHTGWSVVVRGQADEITQLDDLVEVQELPLRAWGPGDKRRYVRVTPLRLTGRRISHPARHEPVG